MKPAQRILLLWGTLILMFFGIWQFLNPDRGPSHRTAPPEPAIDLSQLSIYLPLAVALVAVLIALRAYAVDAQKIEAARLLILEERLQEALLVLAGIKRPWFRAIRRVAACQRAFIDL